ncbi:MAG: hypothetical protein WD795_17735 [Woeseia sp.]
MKVKSRLADIDFVFGKVEYKKDHLIIHSHPDQPMESKVYVSPDDILSGLGKALSNPRVWVYLLFFPFFLIRYRRRRQATKGAPR